MLSQDVSSQAICQHRGTDGQRRSEVVSAFQELSDALGGTDCLERTAELAKTLV